MKECPKCKAKIHKEARFCLYCMTSFEEKEIIENKKTINKRWLYIIAAVLVFVALLLVLIVWLDSKQDPPAPTQPDESVATTIPSEQQTVDTSAPVTDTKPSSSADEQQTSDGTENSPVNDKPSGITQQNGTSSGTVTSDESVPTQDTPVNPAPEQNETDDTPIDPPPEQNESDDTPVNPAPEQNETDDIQSKYSYEDATISNAYPTGYGTVNAPENSVVITKVNYIEESGNYVIPDTIDGKKVAAIMPDAFGDAKISALVKSVSLPSTVRTIWGNAFNGCVNLTDLYLKSTAVEIYKDAFVSAEKRSGKLTIHCKKDCRNFDYYYYRNIADSYGAEYVEWNG